MWKALAGELSSISQQLRELSLQRGQLLPFATVEHCRALVCHCYHFWLAVEGWKLLSSLLSPSLKGTLDPFCVPQARHRLPGASHCSQDGETGAPPAEDVYPPQCYSTCISLLHCSWSWCCLRPAKCPCVVWCGSGPGRWVLQLC